MLDSCCKDKCCGCCGRGVAGVMAVELLQGTTVLLGWRRTATVVLVARGARLLGGGDCMVCVLGLPFFARGDLRFAVFLPLLVCDASVRSQMHMAWAGGWARAYGEQVTHRGSNQASWLLGTC